MTDRELGQIEYPESEADPVAQVGARRSPDPGETFQDPGPRPGSAEAMDVQELHQRLEAMVFMVLSVRRSVQPAAEALTRFPRARIELLLRQIELITKTSVELAYHFCVYAPQSLRYLEDQDMHDWALHVLEVYDHGGTQGCILALQGVAEYARTAQAQRSGYAFSEVAGLLETFICGLSGRPLKLQTGEQLYTDTECLHLPGLVARFRERGRNFSLYKAMAAHLWAQTWYGTWQAPVKALMEEFPDPRLALHIYHALETRRLNACIERELPGLWREMARLDERPRDSSLPGAWREAAARLGRAGARAQDSLALLPALYAGGYLPAPLSYQGVLLPEAVAEVMAQRTLRERRALQVELAVLADELGGNLAAAGQGGRQFEVRTLPNEAWPEGFAYQLVLGDQPLAVPADVQQLLDSIVQDFGHVPAACLEPAGQGVYHRKRGSAADAGEAEPGAGSFTYDEWDYQRQRYRKAWCVLKERDVHPQSSEFVEGVLHKHRGLLKHLYRTFEALRDEDKLLKRQPFGENVDIDALVESHADVASGLEGSDNLFIRKHRLDRSIAVLFMVDMSGSTKGWINDVEREALVLLCESLNRLGDRYAIYGFSGYTHMRCEVFRVKDFADAYDERVKSRISGIQPQDYTRMGAVIRHLSGKLLEVEARTRLLITLSDGRPDDEDGYRGDYGIEDTRQALFEARFKGIHPFCITIDDEAQAYLPHMFGASNYTVIEEVGKLPYKVSDIYRRITA